MRFREKIAASCASFSCGLLILCSVLWMSCTLFAFAARGPSQLQALVSDSSLRAFQRANTYGATLFHMPAPGSDFLAQMRRALPRDYPQMDTGMRTAMADIERTQPYLTGFFTHSNPQQLASLVQTYRAKIMVVSDPVEQQVRLAEVMAVSGMTAYRKSKTAAATGPPVQQQQMQALKYKQLQGAMRSYSPTCNPGRADASANFQNCHP
jgi:hypothetical protein